MGVTAGEHASPTAAVAVGGCGGGGAIFCASEADVSQWWGRQERRQWL